ncbi:hypothetical protein M427DRAFT_87701, partial [Gonapodya prolifera JEL478]
FDGDIEKLSEYTHNKSIVIAETEHYLDEHPELKHIISDYLQFLLYKKPEDVWSFTRDYF